MALDWTIDTTQALLDHGSTTVQTVLDSDGKLKNALHNKALRTDLSDTDYWNLDGVGTPVVSGVSPSGKVAYLLTEDTSTGLHGIYDSFDFTAGDYYGFPFDFKANGSRTFSVQLPSSAFGASVQWTFDPVALTATQDTSGTKDAGTIKSLGDDWYRAVVYAEATSTTGGSCYFMGNNGSTSSYTGDGSSGLYLSRHRILKASVHAPVERVTNGVAPSTTTGWTEGDAATTLTIASSTLRVTGSDGTAAYITQDQSIVVGETYRVAYEVVGINGSGSAKILCGGYDTGNTLGVGSGVFTFTATTTGLLFLSNGSNSVASDYVDWDNVSVTKVITDGVQLDDDGEDFMETSGAAVYSDGVAYDGNGACRGLQCFSGSTNLSTTSNSTWTAITGGTVAENAAIGLDGDLSATLYTMPAATGVYGARGPTYTAASGLLACRLKSNGQNTVSLWHNDGASGRAVFNLTTGAITDVSSLDDYGAVDLGDGWWACWIYSATLTAQSVRVYAGDGSSDTYNGSDGFYLYGSEHNTGSVLKPYTPTNGSAVARSATGASKATSSFGHRQDQGTVVVEFQSAGSNGSSNPSVFTLSDDTSSNQLSDFLTSSNDQRWYGDNGGTNFLNSSMGAYTPDAVSTHAVAYKQNDFAASDDGDAVVTDGAGTPPPVSVVKFGTNAIGGNHLNGYIKRIIYEPIRAANDTLVAESS